MLPSRPCLTASWHPTYVKKKITNHLIDVIWEALGGELNVCPRALGKGRERERWQDHRATVNNVTVWIMSSLFAGASTGLMTETCFWLGLTPTYRCVCMTQYTRTPQHTGGKSGRVASGKGTLVCLVKQRGIKGGRRHHTSLIHPFIVSFDLSIFVIQIIQVGLLLWRLELKPKLCFPEFIHNLIWRLCNNSSVYGGAGLPSAASLLQ